MLCWGFLSQSSAQDRFFKNAHVVNRHMQLSLDSDRILVYVDETNEKRINEVKNLNPDSFIESSFVSRFEKGKTYWLYYRIMNRASERLSHLLRGGNNPQEIYYVIIDDEIIENKTGFEIPSIERSIAQGFDTKIRLDSPPFSSAHVYVKIENNNQHPIEIKASIEPYDEWAAQKDRINLFEGVFSGLVIVIIIINFFLYAYTKQTVFIYFALYSLFNLLYFLHIYGIIEIWLFPNIAGQLQILKFSPILSAVFYCYFAREFLDLKSFSPKWHKSLHWVAIIASATFVLLCIYLTVSGNWFVSKQIFEIVISLLTLIAIILLICINRKPNLIVRYFTFGTILFLLFVMISAGTKSIGQPIEIPIYIQIGLIIELIVFCLGVSHKLKRDIENHEITQESLILQLKNNERLQLNINQELSELVAARTQIIKKQNKALEKAREKAEKATKAKSEFLSVMSHEIRTPLNAIISLSHIMEMDNEVEEMQEYIDALKFSAEGLHSLINDVLDFNKIEADKLVLESIEFSIIDLLKNIRDSFKYKAKSQGIDLLIEVGEHMPDRVIGDPTRLTQIFNNLIGNALKFTHEGNVHIKAMLGGLNDDIATINFEVNDTGIGIPKDKLQTIFEAYEQAGDETTREYGGTGLGLSITQKLLNLMGSKITIESAEKEGTKLSFSILFKINQAFDVVNLQEETRDKDLQQKSILVVDDNDMNRLVLKRLLYNWNANFVEAADGQVALEKCHKKEFDLILMDLEMKPISGFESAETIRLQSKLNKNTPIVAMSGYLASDFDKEIKNSEFLALVQKPFEPNELYRNILKHILQKP